MNPQFLTLALLNGNPNEIDGRVFTIKGHIISSLDLHITIKEGDNVTRLQIIDPTLNRRMLAACSINVGGALFDDPGEIIGKLSRLKNGQFFVSSVEYGTLYQQIATNTF